MKCIDYKAKKNRLWLVPGETLNFIEIILSQAENVSSDCSYFQAHAVTWF